MERDEASRNHPLAADGVAAPGTTAGLLPPGFATAALMGATALLVGLLLVRENHAALAWGVLALALLAALFLLHRSLRAAGRLRAELRHARRRHREIYDNAGLSIWQEDWSEVGATLLALRRSGVVDIPAWFAARPDELRALHARVTITDVNRFTVRLMRAYDRGALLGSLAAVAPESLANFSRWIAALARGDEIYVGESTLRRGDGTPIACLVTAALPPRLEELGEVMVNIVEITAYKQDQQRLAEARDAIARTQRIATIGALTATIAHEVNSPLAAIASHAAACARWLERPDPDLQEARAAARALIDDTERARAVIARTRSMLVKSERSDAPVNLGAVIAQAIQLVEHEASDHGVTIALDLAEDLPVAQGDAVQIQQVLVNLMLNAVQAMTRTDAHPRELRLSARRETPGGLRVRVADSGEGMTPEARARIFEPFYSTKADGMGLGLAICRSGIEAHGGTLEVESEPGKGSVFSFTLPEMETLA